MSNRGCTPVEVASLLELRDYDLVVRCLELVRLHVPDFAPECRSWEIKVIAHCHHHPDNIYPALAVYSGPADFDTIERFGQKANEWARKQSLGWLLDASAKVSATRWNVLKETGRPNSNGEGGPGSTDRPR
jgi:hypothetical protein